MKTDDALDRDGKSYICGCHHPPRCRCFHRCTHGPWNNESSENSDENHSSPSPGCSGPVYPSTGSQAGYRDPHHYDEGHEVQPVEGRRTLRVQGGGRKSAPCSGSPSCTCHLEVASIGSHGGLVRRFVSIPSTEPLGSEIGLHLGPTLRNHCD